MKRIGRKLEIDLMILRGKKKYSIYPRNICRQTLLAGQLRRRTIKFKKKLNFDFNIITEIFMLIMWFG